MEEAEIRWVGELTKVKVEPGDVFIIHCERVLTMEVRARIAALWKQTMGDAKVLFFDGGLKLGVVQMPAGEARANENEEGA